MDAKVEMFALAVGFGGVTGAKDSQLRAGGDLVTFGEGDAAESDVAVDDRDGFVGDGALLDRHAAVAGGPFFEEERAGADGGNGDVGGLFIREGFKIDAGVVAGEAFRLDRGGFGGDVHAESFFCDAGFGVGERGEDGGGGGLG